VETELRLEPLRHRQTKGAGTDMPSLTQPRHTPTLRAAAVPVESRSRIFEPSLARGRRSSVGFSTVEGTRIASMKVARPKKAPKGAITQDQAEREFSVGQGSIDRAAHVLARGTKPLIKSVEDGESRWRRSSPDQDENGLGRRRSLELNLS
jgi:hypothetical protein